MSLISYEVRSYNHPDHGTQHYAVVYHLSNLDGEEVIDYKSIDYDLKEDAYFDVESWLEDEGIPGELYN